MRHDKSQIVLKNTNHEKVKVKYCKSCRELFCNRTYRVYRVNEEGRCNWETLYKSMEIMTGTFII